MKMATKHEIIERRKWEYAAAGRARKGQILDGLVEATGMHRKAVVRRMAASLAGGPAKPRPGRGRKYGPGVTAALEDAWETCGNICAKRLKAALPEVVAALRRSGAWAHSAADTGALLRMGEGTIKRRLSGLPRAGGRGLSATRPSLLSELVPVRRGPWDDPAPGNGEVDSVAHCGWTLAGDFAWTVQYTDVATTWCGLAAQWGKGQAATLASVERIASRLPFRLVGLDPDSGSEFVNWLLKG